MARWEDVRANIRRSFQLDRDDLDEFALTVPRNAGAREQRVMVRRYVHDGREMIEFRSAFGEITEADPVAMLRETLHLPLGAIALHGKFLVVIHREALAPLSVDGVIDLLTKVSLIADELEERLGSDRF